jgi:hypothetical protein
MFNLGMREFHSNVTVITHILFIILVIILVTLRPLTVNQTCFRVTVPVCIELLDALLKAPIVWLKSESELFEKRQVI